MYVCPQCLKKSSNGAQHGNEEPKEVVFGYNVSFELVDQFCYLGDMIGAGDGAGDASRARVRSGWKKFHGLAPILTLRELPSN
jgi:hypothetical protein